MKNLLEGVYRRHGPRYPERAVFAQLQLVFPLVALNIGALALYVDVSWGEYLRLVGVGVGAFFAYHLAYMAVARRALIPVRRWLEGERNHEATVAAWKTCASFPREMFRREWTGQLGVLGYTGLLLFAVYTTWVLDFPAYTVAPLVAGVAVFVLYVQTLRFLALEQILRPVLADIARQATDEVDLYAPGPPLRIRLLATLPALNVITAVPVAGVLQSGDDLGDLGLAVLMSVAVASTISLALTLLLADSVTAPLDALRQATRRIGQGDFTARIPVVTTDETGELARSFNQMAAGLAERERIRDAFGTYVDRDVAEHILREGTSLEGEEVEVTMLFLDIRGFTTFAERLSASEVVGTLNRLFERIVPLIHAHSGHVDKYVGDGLLAVFGAPRRQADHADQALAAGLKIAAAVEDEFKGELSVGVGLNSGPVVAGNVGGAGRLEFSVIGDAVNVAARVESATRQTGDAVLIAGRTKALLTDTQIPFVERSGLTLKGKTQPVAIYAPVPSGTPTPSPAPRS